MADDQDNFLDEFIEALTLIKEYDSRMSDNSRVKLNWILNQNYTDVRFDLKSLKTLITNAFSLGYSCGRKDVEGDE